MMELFVNIFTIMLFSAFYVYSLSTLLNVKRNYKSKVIAFIIIFVSHFLSNLVMQTYIRPVILYLVIMLGGLIISKDKISKAAFSAFISWFIVFISELFVAIFVMGAMKLTLSNVKNDYIQIIIINVSIFICSNILLNNEFLKNKLKNYINKESETNAKYIILLLLFSAIALSIIFYMNYFKLGALYTLILSLIFVGVYVLVVMKLLKEKDNNYKMTKQNDILQSSLLDYEKLYERQRIDNHENRNQLLIIRSMANSKNKELINYIDKITDIEGTDNKNYIEQLRKLPSNGVRGLINFKIIEMEQKRIKVNLYISKKVNYKKLQNISDEMNFDICKLIGIYLDNAIQEVENKNNRNIDISIYEEDNELCIAITNNFENNIDLEKINNEGYSTKGKGHGFGLAIAKKVLEKNKNIEVETSIMDTIFEQKIIIKM